MGRNEMVVFSWELVLKEESGVICYPITIWADKDCLAELEIPILPIHMNEHDFVSLVFPRRHQVVVDVGFVGGWNG